MNKNINENSDENSSEDNRKVEYINESERHSTSTPGGDFNS